MKIVLSTGGTAGHVFPALYVARQLTSQGHEVVFVGALSKSLDRIQRAGHKAFILEAKGLTAGSMLESGVLMARAFGRSLRILNELKPDAVCGFGGYGAFAVVLAAVTSKVPAMIHEQNVIPGRANKLLSGLVRRVAVSFKCSEQFFGPRKTVWTGCPCRDLRVTASRESLLREFGLSAGKITILVLGGSQGSQRINEIFAQAAGDLKNDLAFQVLHLAGGGKNAALLAERYRSLGIPCRVFDFLDEMEKAYAVADLAVARAGALTVNEIARSRLPAILVPYPYAGGHQKANAQVLADLGMARLVEEKDLGPGSLREAVLAWAKERPDRHRFEAVVPGEFPADPVGRLAGEILRIKS